MKRAADGNASFGLRKRKATVSSLGDVSTNLPRSGDVLTITTTNVDFSELIDHDEYIDDGDSNLSETDQSSAGNAPPVQTAPTSIAASTISRAGRKFPSDLKKIPCPQPGCDKTFNRPARLTAHLRSHSNGLLLSSPP